MNALEREVQEMITKQTAVLTARIAALEAAGNAMAEGLQLHTATKECDLCVAVLAAWREATGQAEPVCPFCGGKVDDTKVCLTCNEQV
jgi:hypothetical protein